MATLHLPALMRHLAGGSDVVRVELPPGAEVTVRELLERANSAHPGLMEALLDDDDLVPGLAVFIDNEQALLRLRAKVAYNSEVRLLPPIVGG